MVMGAAVTPVGTNATISANPCSGTLSNEGANVASRVQRMGADGADADYANRATLNAAVNAVQAAARTPLTEALYEAYRYYSGHTPRFGTLTSTATAGGVVTAGRDVMAVCTAGGTQDCPRAGVYRSPMLRNPDTSTTPAGCQKNFVIMITDGGPEDDWSANAEVKRLQYNGPLGAVASRTNVDANQTNTTTDQFEVAANAPYGPVDIASTNFDGGYVWLDELAYFMATADVSPGAANLPGDSGPDLITGRQVVVTYTIGFAGGDSAVLSNAGPRGNGRYLLAEDSSTLRSSLETAITAIRDWNPTIAAPTVPISALNRAENSTDVYLAFFQPSTRQAWLGTVKKYGLSTDPLKCGPDVGLCLIGQTELTKAAPNFSPAYNIETIETDTSTIPATQQIIVDRLATSFWGPSTLQDGSKPDEGGTGYQLKNTSGYNPSTRAMYTFVRGTGMSAQLISTANKVSEDNTAITKCLLGDTAACSSTPTMSDSVRSTLINYALGGDSGTANCSDATSTTACTAWRTWPHFDVQHSKPAVVLYDSTSAPVVEMLYYLSNDGLLHAIKTSTGEEQWSFLIEEMFGKLSPLMANNAGEQLDAGDGSIAVYVKDGGDGKIDAGDKAYLYFGLRRGGRAYYALDVTDPAAPALLWKIEGGTGKLCLAGGACGSASEYNELGQTWSTPTVGVVRALGASTPVLIFGGGYDPAEDGAPPTVLSGNTMGRQLYVINGTDGSLVKAWGAGASSLTNGSMLWSIPSDAIGVNSDYDAQGFLDRVYIGDVGGNVFRFDINDTSASNWAGRQIAQLSVGEPRRKIFFPPAVVPQINPERFDAVFIGTGDHEHPRLATTGTSPVTAADKLFMIMDRDTTTTMSRSDVATFPNDFVPLANSDTGGVDPSSLLASKGWYRDLDDGEKVINSPTVFFQRLRFGTYAPKAQTDACTPAGEGRLNEIDALYGGLFNLNTADGLSATDRYYSNFITRGFISTGQIVVIGKKVYHIVVSDARLKANLLGSIGDASKIYWYMEPEQ